MFNDTAMMIVIRNQIVVFIFLALCVVIPSVSLLQLHFAHTYHAPSTDFQKMLVTRQIRLHVMSTIHQTGQPHQSFKYAHFIYFQLLQTEAVMVSQAHILELLVHNRGSHSLGSTNISD